MGDIVRIAMWSGPRNMSTTMMRSFGARADTWCADEPFYAAFLAITGANHPMRDDILASQDIRADTVAQQLLTSKPDRPDQIIHYQKHMTHHMVDPVMEVLPSSWLARLRHVFLIRHPARVLASYARKHDELSLEAIGLTSQWALYQRALNLGATPPPVIDSDDILRNPEGMMQALCNALNISFDPAMLCWTPGRKPEDGVWAPHWYEAVWASSGFGAAPEQRDRPIPQLTGKAADILQEALPIYNQLAGYRVQVGAVRE